MTDTTYQTMSKLNKILQYSWSIMLGVILAGSFITCAWLSYLDFECKAFWKESCSIVSSPDSIKPMFEQKWYDKYNKVEPAPAASTP